MQTMTASDEQIGPRHGNDEDRDYEDYLSRLGRRFSANVADGKEPLFTTSVAPDDLWEAYLGAFPEDQRQYHNCSACRRFIKTVGGLVTISGAATSSAVWDLDDAPELYRASVAAMLKIVKRAKVTGVFLSSDMTIGHPVTGTWRHFSVELPKAIVFKRVTLTARQKMAERREDFTTVMRALEEFTAPMVLQALQLLKTDALYRSEKVLGQAQWLADLHAALESTKGPRANVVWRAIALAPAGFCHPRSSMIGTLLDDIAAGLDFADASRKFAAKMHPLQYQRPQAAPTAGAIAQAEKLIAELGAAGSLARRFARLDDVQTLWMPTAKEEPKTGGVFGHLKPKGAESPPSMTAPAQVMTWEKFQRTVLPEAHTIEALVPLRGNFCALVTSANADAPPILQWDNPENRNPVSWYVYNGGSLASQWGVSGGSWCPVTALTFNPAHWNYESTHHSKGVLFILDGAKDSRGASAGAGLFPEILKSDFHGIRSTIEAYSRSAKIEGHEESAACGLLFGNGSEVRLRVTDKHGMKSEYRLDRFD